MENKNLKIIIDGKLNAEVVDVFENLEKASEDSLNKLNEFRKLILSEMKENDILTLDASNDKIKLKITRVIPNDIETFDDELFLENEDTQFLDKFVTITSTKLPFDTEKFSKDYPELYEKYCKTIDTFSVNTDNLKKMFPDVYNTYTQVIKSTKSETLRIGKSKVKGA